jgi:hypothetical protein
MGNPSSVGMNNDIMSSKMTDISLRSTNDELSGWVDVKVVSLMVVKAHSRVTGLEFDEVQTGNDQWSHVFVKHWIV